MSVDCDDHLQWDCDGCGKRTHVDDLLAIIINEIIFYVCETCYDVENLKRETE